MRRRIGDVLRTWSVTLLAVAVLTFGPAPADAQAKRWAPVPGKCHVSFDASYPLGDFMGHTEDVTGEFFADLADLRQGVSGTLQVNPAALRTGIDGRDRDMRRVLEVERYPEIRFTVERVDPSFPSVSDRSDVLVTINGTMLIHGVERQMAFPGRVRLRDERLWVRGENRLKMTDFGIKPPRKLLLQVADTVLVSFDVVLAPRD